jgi:glycosyltransferase involved in cell wall biosynthesis
VTLGINLIPGRFKPLMKEYDIVHFHEAEFSFPFFSYFVKKPKILHLHGLRFDYYERYRLTRILLKTAADLYLSISKQIQRELAILGIPRNRIVHFPNAVDTKVFYPGEKLDDTILYVGRITPDKGLHVLLRSLIYVKRPVRLVIIGPLDWSSEYCRNILQLIKSEKSRGKHKVEYLGRVDQTELIQWHRRASIFVLPSFYEPFAVAILEAMSCETPVISTYAGGIPEVVKNGETGILVPINNPLKLAEAIDYLLDNNDVRIKMGQAARSRITENFALEVLVKKLCEIYEKVVNN